jgi:hypothetical protein
MKWFVRRSPLHDENKYLKILDVGPSINRINGKECSILMILTQKKKLIRIPN